MNSIQMTYSLWRFCKLGQRGKSIVVESAKPSQPRVLAAATLEILDQTIAKYFKFESSGVEGWHTLGKTWEWFR